MADNDEKAPKAERAPKGRRRSRAARAPRRKQAQQAKGGDKAATRARRSRMAATKPKGKRPEQRVTPRLRTHFDAGGAQAAHRAERLQESDAGADHPEGRHQHGHRRGRQRPQEGRDRRPPTSALIAGQKAIITKSRKSIATYKLRDGQAIGCKVTLRKTRMYEFLDRLINIALPRVRDFRGLNPKSFDGRGNYSLGIKEHIVFPEIDYDKAADIWGMDITVCTSAKTDDEARALLTAFNFPFRQ